MPTLDFVAAKLTHSSWKLKLRRYLDGEEVLTPHQATDHDRCEVGRWLADPEVAPGMSIKGHTEIAALAEAHRALHASVRRIIETMEAGRRDEAEREFALADQHSQRVVSLLESLQKASARRAA